MYDLIALNVTISCKILVKIGPVVLAENRLTNRNCTATHLNEMLGLIFFFLLDASKCGSFSPRHPVVTFSLSVLCFTVIINKFWFDFDLNSASIWRSSSIHELEYWNSDFNVFIGHQFSALCEILVRFGSVTPEFKTSEVGGMASKIVPHLVQVQPLGGGHVRHWRDQ